jgi:hypothetical protein
MGLATQLRMNVLAERAAAKQPNKALTATYVAGQMLTGQIHPKGDGGFAGLKAPMGYSTAIFLFIVFPVMFLIAFCL